MDTHWTDHDTSAEYGKFAEFYDSITPYRLRADVEFFVEEARAADGPVLEIGCGTGRVLIPTARAGVSITGLDASSEMLQGCRQSLGREPADVAERVRLAEGDMRSFSFASNFALITVPFRPFQHLLTVEDQLRALRCMAAHLQPEGRLILDLFDPNLEALAAAPGALEYRVEAPFTMTDGRVVTRRTRIASCDWARQLIGAEMEFHIRHPDGREEMEVDRFPLRYLFRYEVEHLLARAGMRVTAIYGDYARRPFGERYPQELIVVATLAV